ncbi:MAG: nucleoside hydrolase [Synergistaceae bacterium]|jgi:inosine-uridine nucleoside N-ribohydrolase|nr:nucleoside hydrolase [Synergistaceae bacterium]
MRRRTLICLFLAVSFVSIASVAFAAEVKKVILDSDMRPGFDDGAAMVLLCGWMRMNDDNANSSPNPSFNKIDLLGVTVEPGNEAQQRGFAHGVRQLEIINAAQLRHSGSTKVGIPIYMGARYGLRSDRMDEDVMKAEWTITGASRAAGYFGWVTNPAFKENPNRDPMQPWQEFFKGTDASDTNYGKYGVGDPVYPYAYYPKQRDGSSKADDDGIDNAVDFIIKTVNDNPDNEVTILAIGPLTNIALALRKDPSIAGKVKEIVYMGGSFYMKGNSSAVAEFNWWADPEAAKMCVRTPWGDQKSATFEQYGNQVIDGLEAAVYLESLPTSLDIGPATPGSNYSRAEENWFAQSGFFYDDLVDQCRFYRTLPRNSGAYDVIAAAWLVDPNVVTTWYSASSRENPVTTNTDMVGLYVDVDSNYSTDYGRSIAYAHEGNQSGPLGTQKGAIMANTDPVKFWNEIVAPAFRDPAKTTPTP